MVVLVGRKRLSFIFHQLLYLSIKIILPISQKKKKKKLRIATVCKIRKKSHTHVETHRVENRNHFSNRFPQTFFLINFRYIGKWKHARKFLEGRLKYCYRKAKGLYLKSVTDELSVRSLVQVLLYIKL